MTLRTRYRVTAWFQWQYDSRCREGLEKLWTHVADDGCVMTNPLRGQLEGVGWVVYVQHDGKDQEFRGDTLLQAVNMALEELDLV